MYIYLDILTGVIEYILQNFEVEFERFFKEHWYILELFNKEIIVFVADRPNIKSVADHKELSMILLICFPFC